MIDTLGTKGGAVCFSKSVEFPQCFDDRNITIITSNLILGSSTIILCIFIFFLITGLYFLICGVIVQIINPTVETGMPTGATTNQANAEIETTTDSRKKNKKVFEVMQAPLHTF